MSLSKTIHPLLSTGPNVIKKFTCSTQMSKKFQFLVKSELLKNTFLAIKLSNDVFIMLKMVKCQQLLAFYYFTSMINIMLC